MRHVHRRCDCTVSVGAVILGVRSALFRPDVLVRDHVQAVQEIRACAGHDYVFVGVLDHGRGLPFVPHEQLEVPARGGLCPDRVLHADRAVEGDPGEGRATGAGRLQHPVSQIHPDV